jgi:hypothetical protein
MLAYRSMTWQRGRQSTIPLQTSSVVPFLAVASNMYGSVFARLGTTTLLAEALLELPISPMAVLALLGLVIFILGRRLLSEIGGATTGIVADLSRPIRIYVLAGGGAGAALLSPSDRLVVAEHPVSVTAYAAWHYRMYCPSPLWADEGRERSLPWRWGQGIHSTANAIPPLADGEQR